MGMCASGDILKSKLDKLLSYIDGFKIDIDNIIVLRNYFFTNHTEQLRVIFGKLRAASLKVNAPK